jgi:hypothetical protein
VRRLAVAHTKERFKCSERRACKALSVARSSVRYKSARIVSPALAPC